MIQCSIRGKANLGEECHGALPELGDDVPFDPCLTPEPLLWCFKGKEPQTIITPAYIWHAEPMMMYTDDARPASSKATRHHGLRAWEQMVGNGQACSLSGIQALDYKE